MQQHDWRRQRGFTYLSLMILLAIIGLVTASAVKLGSVLQRSRAEQELLVVGAAFSDALQSYAEATPAGQSTIPPSLQELLRDPRFPTPRRHLRKIFVDPVSGKAEWGVVYAGEKTGVLSVYSLSNARPVKISNFPARYAGFAGMNRISDWKFSGVSKTGSPPVTAEMQPQTPGNVVRAPREAEKTSDSPNLVQGEEVNDSENPSSAPETPPSTNLEEKANLPLRQDSH